MPPQKHVDQILLKTYEPKSKQINFKKKHNKKSLKPLQAPQHHHMNVP
jgi:hypothetical protein